MHIANILKDKELYADSVVKEFLITADWRKNVDNLLTFQEKDILQGSGSITNYEAEETAKQVYDVFNSKRKQVEAQNADADDLKMLEDLEQSLKNKQGDKE